MISRVIERESIVDSSGTRVRTVQDNGGISVAGQGFVSRALANTHDAKLTLTLTSYPNVTDAMQGYTQSATGSSAPPVALPGVGDKAVARGTAVVVLKGAQLLSIETQPTDAADAAQLIAKKTGVPQSQAAIDAAQQGPARDAAAFAKAIAPRLNGQTVTGSPKYLPKGAFDPCGFDASQLNRGHIRVTSIPVFPETNGASDCVYTFTGATRGEPGTGSLRVSTMTTAQGAAALVPRSPSAEFDSIPNHFGGRNTSAGGPRFGTASSGPLNAMGATTGEPNFAFLLGPKQTASDPALLIQIIDEHSTYVVGAAQCAEAIDTLLHRLRTQAMLRGSPLGASPSDADEGRIDDKIRDWCAAVSNPAG